MSNLSAGFNRLIKNNIFRISVLYSLLFIMASIAMLVVAYVSIENNIKSSIEREVNSEIIRFIGDSKSVELGIKSDPYAYFIEQAGHRVAGNITEIPEHKKKSNKSQDLIQIKAIRNREDIIGKTINLPNETKLFIGKSSYDAKQRRQDILDAFITALSFLLVFGIIGGLIISFQSIKRIDRISKVSKSINAGDLSLRIPKTKHKDDIEDLSQNINSMLDRIDALMQGMREVTNNIAHDLRTPLTRLRASIETISNISKDRIKEESDSALMETDSILNTFTSLLRISQVESGAKILKKENLDLSELINEIVDFYGVLAEEKDQELNIYIEKNTISYVDRSLISQAIVNLLSNAVKYTQKNGKIRVSLIKDIDKSLAKLIVHDSGMGVPDSELHKITRRFYRLEKHRTIGNGNGLGLSMVEAIVNAHKGRLVFENDIGLKAIVYLPIIKL